MLRIVRKALDALYLACGFVSAVFLLLLLAIILVQILARWTGYQFPGSTDYAGYCMAAASFFALAYTLNSGAHIRVTLAISNFTGSARRWAEIWCVAVATGLSWYFAWYAYNAVQVSRLINDISQGQDATPLWIPQLAMAIGTIVLGIAFTDNLVQLLAGTKDAVDDRAVE